MSFGDYLTGVIALAAVAAPLALASIRLRGRLLPGWNGTPARLVELTVALSLLTVLLQVLGAVGLFRPLALVFASIAVGGSVLLGVRGTPGGEGEEEGTGGEAGAAGAHSGGPAVPPAPAIPWTQTAIALGVAAFVAAHWATGLQDVWARGMLTFDTLWYHGPFAARIAEEGSVWGLHFTDPLYLNWFYPQNSELLHAAGISLLDRDLASPLVNFGWLGASLLAAWCIGRPYGVAPLSMVAVALALDIGPMVPREAGTPANDIAPVALLLVAAAVLVNAAAGRREGGDGDVDTDRGGDAPGWWLRPPLRGLPAGAVLVAGLAMGLAMGTKMTIAGAVAAMAIGLPLTLPAEQRKRALLLFLGGIAATAGFWFLRNLIHSGNPLPWLRDLGPIELPGPDRGLEGRDNFTVAHYLFSDPDTSVWNQYFYRPITNLLGPAWPLLLGLSAAGMALAILRPRTAVVRLLGLVTLVSAFAYLFTPLTAAGPEGRPLAFGINLRYLVPALSLGLALLTLEPRLTPQRFRLPLLAGGVLALALTSFYSDSAYIWREPFASVPAAVLIGLVLVGGPVAVSLLARRNTVAAIAAAAALALTVLAVGWERQDDYLDSRYSRADDFRFQLAELPAWARETGGLDIGVVGTSGAFNQYLLSGEDLSNRVQYIGREEPGGDFRALGGGSNDPGKCANLIEAVNGAGYDYVVTTPELDLNDPATAKASPERGWLKGASGAEEELRRGRVSIFRIDGALDAADCKK